MSDSIDVTLPEKIKRELIDVGNRDLLPYDSVFSGSPELAYLFYGPVLKTFTDDEVISVFKGLVICEKLLKWKCGSTTPAARVYQYIERRGLDPEYLFADWAFQYSDNEYVPFGFMRHGEKTAIEYLQWREDYEQRLFTERVNADNRRKEKIKRALQISAMKKAEDSERREYYSELMQLPYAQQLDVMCNDKEHSILFYVPVIEHLRKQPDVPQVIFDVIIKELSSLKSTPYNRKLIKKLEQADM